MLQITNTANISPTYVYKKTGMGWPLCGEGNTMICFDAVQM